MDQLLQVVDTFGQEKEKLPIGDLLSFFAAFSVNVVRIIEPGATPSQQMNFRQRATNTSVFTSTGSRGYE